MGSRRIGCNVSCTPEGVVLSGCAISASAVQVPRLVGARVDTWLAGVGCGCVVPVLACSSSSSSLSGVSGVDSSSGMPTGSVIGGGRKRAARTGRAERATTEGEAMRATGDIGVIGEGRSAGDATGESVCDVTAVRALRSAWVAKASSCGRPVGTMSLTRVSLTLFISPMGEVACDVGLRAAMVM